MNEVRGTEFYTNGEANFISNGYVFPEFTDNRGVLDIIEMQGYNSPQGYADSLVTPPPNMDRKRKGELKDIMDEDTKHVRLSPQEDKKFVRQNHSEIEKRRRDKMNTYISELSAMIPTCVAMQRKMDKLTVLRLAVQHVKSIRGSIDSYTQANYKPPMLNDRELLQLIVPCADGFLFVVDSARTRILYVSETVGDILNFGPRDLLGQSLFDILHPKDIDKVKEQLSNYDSTPRERLIDSKTMLPLKGGEMPLSTNRLHPGARRAFFCRMKCKPSTTILLKEEEEDLAAPSPMLNSGYSGQPAPTPGKKKNFISTDKKYISIQCTGYLKSWPLSKVCKDAEINDLDQDSDTCVSCLVAVGRLQPSFQPILEDCVDRGKATASGVEFFSRHGIDGKFTYVDQRVTLLVGYLPQELLGTSLYEHVQYDDIPVIAECHRNTLKTPEEVLTPFFRFRTKEGKFVNLESKWKQFRNPWTKEIEYILCKNYLLITQQKVAVEGSSGAGSLAESGDLEFFSNGRDSGAATPAEGRSPAGGRGGGIGREIHRVISSHAEAAKIGKHIADEIIEKWRSDSSASNSPFSSLQGGSPNTGGQGQSSTSHSGHPSEAKESQLLREAMAEVEQDRNKLSGVIVSRAATTSGLTSSSRAAAGGGGGAGAAGGGGGSLSLSDQIMRGAMHARQHSPPSSSHSSEGNDEAATAVLMSLLEAEGGLGGPFDFASLPWPLP